MKKLFLLTLLLLPFVIMDLKAQNTSKPQVWVDAQMSLGFLDVHPFQLGLGGGVQLSVEKPINAQTAFGVHIGARRMGAYNRAYGVYAFHILPTGYHQIETNTKLLALGFVDIGANFKHRPNLKSPWSWSLGVDVSLLTQPVGQQYEHYTIDTRNPIISETTYESGTLSSGSTSGSSLSSEGFARYDMSMEAAFYYEITKGCAIKAAFRQGAKNLIKPELAPNGDAQHYLSALSFGFSARLR